MIKNYLKENNLSDVFKRCEGLEVKGDSVTCFLCEQGYALSHNGNCIKIRQQNCLVAWISELNEKEGTEQCLVCTEYQYYPNKKGKCIKMGVSNFENKGEANKIANKYLMNCKYGGFDPVDEQARCAICQNEYAILIQTSNATIDEDNLRDTCVSIGIDKGCQRIKEGKCIWCNHYDGYYMSMEGVCKKEGTLWMVFAISIVLIVGYLP